MIPYLISFAPSDSVVVIGASLPADRIQVVLRYDLPNPPDRDLAAGLTAHAAHVLAREDRLEREAREETGSLDEWPDRPGRGR